MKAKVLTFTIATAITALLLIATAALAQTALDPTQAGAYPAHSDNPLVPDYLDYFCGGVKLAVLDEQNLVAMVRATTTCSTGGRGTKPKNYAACWRVTFAEDRFYILDRERVLYSVTTYPTTRACPAL